MDFTIDSRLAGLQRRVREFIAADVMPLESDPRQGAHGPHELVSEAVCRVDDRCVQVLGGQGVSGETILMRIYKDIRGFRIYDGHR